MNSRDFSRLAMILIEEEEKIREIELKTTAAILIQSFWREKIFWSVRTHLVLFPQRKSAANSNHNCRFSIISLISGTYIHRYVLFGHHIKNYFLFKNNF